MSYISPVFSYFYKLRTRLRKPVRYFGFRNAPSTTEALLLSKWATIRL